MPFDSPAHWQQARSFHHSRYDEAFLAARERSVSVCLPARDCAATVGPIVELLAGLVDRGAIDQLVVIDGGSHDATARIAADAGAAVWSEAGAGGGGGGVRGGGGGSRGVRGVACRLAGAFSVSWRAAFGWLF